jgi:hypothetical protein
MNATQYIATNISFKVINVNIAKNIFSVLTNIFLCVNYLAYLLLSTHEPYRVFMGSQLRTVVLNQYANLYLHFAFVKLVLKTINTKM